jgi:Bacterial Ig-like domain (group 3)/BNR repeat-like domain/Carboxypeptidase regulatory-like domain
MALFGSTDGGTTWTYNCAPWPATVTGGVIGAVYWFGSDPALSWDSQGRAYACYMLISQNAAGTSGAAIVVARSSDYGASWQNLGTVVNGIASTTQGNDKEMMAIDNTSGQAFSHPGRIYVIWDAANAEKIANSDDGAAWTTVNFPSNTGAIGGNVVVGADGTVYAIWTRYNVETIVFSKSTDGGATWTAPQVIATLALQSFGTNNKPAAQDKRGINAFGAIDVDRNPASSFFGNLYVSFPDFPSGTTTGADINSYVVRSTNGGTSWSSRVKVNDDNFGGTQIFPWLAVDQSDGTVNVSWYDSRLDPLNRQTQMVSSRSADGGVSFEPNILVSDGGSAWRNNVNYTDENSADNTTYNSNQYGDYSGIAAFNRQVHPLWTDSRMFFPVADTQSPTRREDNATSVLTYCSAPSAIAGPAVNSSTAPSVAVSWSAPAGWGTNATNGTYSVFRNTSPVFPSGSPVASDLTSTSYVDTTGVNATTYYYFVRAKNNCPGTALTPMSTDSPASAAVDFGSTGTPVGNLQGTVTVGSNPVSGVVVTAGTFSATTNASGFYLFVAINTATYTVSASPTGYNPASVNGVVVTDGGTTIQNLAITAVTSASCFTDTTYGDFSPGGGSNVDIASIPGDVKLRNLGVEGIDQVSSPAALSTTNNLSATTWTGQTFRAGVTGNLTKMNLGLGLASGTSGTITVEIRNLNGINPGTTVLATSTAGPVTNVGTAALYTTTFATPAALVSGTSYSVVLRTSVGSTVFGVRGSTAGGSTLANGQVFTTTTSGTLWTPVAADLYFTTYVTPPLSYPASGNLVSGVKDANTVVGLVPRWLTLSWNATTPANTTIQFQAAASNNVNGPFNFVGPDGTTSTFFTTSGASLSQFNGFRYLKYEALFDTTDNIVTPTLNDVTVCFDNDTPLITAAAPLSRQQGSASINSQIATVSDPGQAPNTLTVTSTPVTGNGVIINNISINVAGNVTADVAASCTATNSTFTLTVTNSANATATATLTVNVTAIDMPTITPGGPTTFCEGSSVTLTSSSASGNQWYLNNNPIGGATGQQYIATASGDYTVTANSCNSSVATTVTVNPIPATPTITPGGPTTFCEGGSVTLTSSSASGNQWYLDGNPIGGATNQTYVATGAGGYTVTDTSSGCSSEPSTTTTVTVNPTPTTPTITPEGPTTFCTGGSVTLTSSSASGNQWYLNGNPIGGATNQAYLATAAGNYTNTVTASGCISSPSTATVVTVNPIPATPTITPDGPTTFCTGGSVTLTSSSASGNQWYLNGNPIGGATNQAYIATAAGSYSNVVTTSGCASPPSTATAVTVNPIPATPTITPGGPTTFCTGGNVTLTSSSASGNQWYLNGNPIGGATNQSFIATASGDYTNTVTTTACTSSPSTATAVKVNPIPTTPTITPGGPTTFFVGGNVTLTSSSVSGNQWTLNGNPIGGATAQQYIATASGNYKVTATTNGCTSASSAATTVTVNPLPVTPTITQSFNLASIALNANSTLSFTISNPNISTALSGVAFTDNLPAGLVVAAMPNVTGSCGGGTTTAIAGSSNLSLSGGTLPASPAPGSSCTLSIQVTGTTAGTKNNTSGNVTATYDDGTGNFVPVIGGTATATIQVLKGNQTITFDVLTNKTFGDADFIVSATASSGLSVSFTAAGNCTVTGLTATVHLTSAGSCTITSSQGGDSNYNAATNVVQSFSIAQAASTTALSSSINPSDVGENVSFTATVTLPSNTSTLPGTLQFKDGADNLGSALNCVAGGGGNTCTAQVSSSTLTTGTHAISAIYSGDTNFIGSSGSLAGGQVVTDQPALMLILEESGPDPNQAVTFDLLFLRDPFPILSVASWLTFGPDRNTRVMVFLANLQLNPGETESAVGVNLIDSNNQSYLVPPEDVYRDPTTGFSQVTFRLPDTLSLGACTVKIEAHGHVSNSAIIRIGP